MLSDCAHTHAHTLPALHVCSQSASFLLLCAVGAASAAVLCCCPAGLQRNVPTHIRWTNDLKDAAGAYLPHILRDSIDQTIHWANPAVSNCC